MRKVCVVIGSRANYGSIKSVMRAVREHPDLTLQIIVGASALLDRFGSVVDVIERDGFVPDARVNMIVEGETPVTMAKSTGLGLLELPTLFELLRPDLVITVGDRFETIATAIAAAYMNLPLAHTMGGEVTGTIDESIRHAITKLAHIHFPANQLAADRIIRLGEDPAAVHVVGCPRMDLVAEVTANGGAEIDLEWLEREGVGGHLTTDAPFLLVSQHPVTTEYGQAERQITETLLALKELAMPAIMLWPNVDAGSEDVARGMRKFREKYKLEFVRFYKNFPVETYLRLMKSAACLVGNSSSSIREGAFLGTPAVNLGSRQAGRERAANVVDAPHDRAAIVDAVRRQIAHGPYGQAHIYGDGHAGGRIADVLSRTPLHVQKRIQY
jgi:UDP-hydrolysing UDP-N-acetyl-D-glucosamine 2-epimerase